MYIAMIASECAPVSKVGGLADVVDGLSRELARKGHKVDVILPY
ncbi:Starch synthase catalytic region domain protein, partial [Candidatus Magnetobacterium bavaricum]